MKIMTEQEFYKEKSNGRSQLELDQEIDSIVLDIIRQVRADGDKALYRFTEKFDRTKLDSLLVTEEEMEKAAEKVEPEFLDALRKAKENIESFHSMQKEQSWFTNQQPGIMLGQKVTPLDSVGIYIPGGKAAYPSSVLMNVIPAKIAGVGNIVITTPAQQDGSVSPYVLAAAKETGVGKVYKLGGAQAIAALAYGTESIPKVAKIVGPGNAYVARAKKWVYGEVAIDMIAGPSEICILADETAPARYIAADLLSQAEHDESASAICVTTSRALAEEVLVEIENQTATLERKKIIEESLRQNGRIIIAGNVSKAIDIVNEMAPEHLQLMVANPMEQMQHIRHAGAIFLGNHSPEPLGDYFAGPNHTLPTNGTAKFASPLGVYDFVKRSSIISYSEEALLHSADKIIKIAEVEGLTAHANSIRVRKGKDDGHAQSKD